MRANFQDMADVEARFAEACRLARLGCNAEAQNAYLEVLALHPGHCLALNNLGTLLYDQGFRKAARTAYSEAVARNPEDAMSRVNLGNCLREAGEFAVAREHYEAALQLLPGSPEAHKGLASVLSEAGDSEGAAMHRERGFRAQPIVALPYRGESKPLSILLLAAAEGGNIPLRHLLDDRLFQTTVLFPEYFDPAVALPPHDVVFNGIGDADLAGTALSAAETLLRKTTAVLNPPSAVARTGRAEVAARLAGIPGVVSPRTVTLPRDRIAAQDFDYPLLIRTPGFHTGRHFLKVETPADLPSALAQLPGDRLTVIQNLDARGPDGKFRKYRVMATAGELYPLHVAISANWKIHYFTADMADSADHRSEDQRFLEDMPGVLGESGIAALEEISARLGLDYCGIDFGLGPDREVLLFEANATMVVNPPDPDPRWAYRRRAIERIHEAVRRMILSATSGFSNG
jgi:hypothetical protein